MQYMQCTVLTSFSQPETADWKALLFVKVDEMVGAWRRRGRLTSFVLHNMSIALVGSLQMRGEARLERHMVNF